MKQVVLRKLATATSIIAFAALLTVGWSVESAQARRLYVAPHYGFSPYVADQSGLPWYAVRAYYAGGPWCGVAGGSYSPTVPAPGTGTDVGGPGYSTEWAHWERADSREAGGA